MSTPTTQKTVRLMKLAKADGGKITNPDAFSFADAAVPAPKDGEVLIRVSRAAINPADVLNLQGYYAAGLDIPAEGFTPGLEGSGVVVKSNAGADGERLVGKRVGFASFAGSWGPYVCVPPQRCVPVPDDVSDDVAASCFVNPATVVGFFEVAAKAKVKAIVQSAAASALGRMVIRYAKSNGVKVLNLVRREDQAKVCVDTGADRSDVINTTDGDWKEQLSKWATAHDARICFDAIGGSITGEILGALPANSTVYVYGLLSGQPISGVGGDALIFQNKTVSGFWLVTHLGTDMEASLKQWQKAVGSSLNKTFHTEVAASYPADRIVEALNRYGEKATGGKICVAPNLPYGSQPLGSGEKHATDTPSA